MSTNPSDSPSDACEVCGRDLPPRARSIGVIAWCSFLVAGATTIGVFAFIDPASHWITDRLTGYAVGFFAFWLIAAASAALTLYMVRTEHPPVEKP